MKRHYKYTHEEILPSDLANSVTCYWEVGDDQYVSRSLEVYDTGRILRYDEGFPADAHGILPDKPFDAELARQYGELEEISKQDFEDLWSSLVAENYNPENQD